MYNYQPALEDNTTSQYQRPIYYADSQYKPASDFASSRDGSGNVQNQEPTGRGRKKSKSSEQSQARRNLELGDSDDTNETGFVEFFMLRFTVFRNKWLLLDFLLDFITITLLGVFTFGIDQSCPTDYKLEGTLLFASYIFFTLTTMPTFFVMNTSKKYKPSACMVYYMIFTWIIMTVLLTAWLAFYWFRHTLLNGVIQDQLVAEGCFTWFFTGLGLWSLSTLWWEWQRSILVVLAGNWHGKLMNWIIDVSSLLMNVSIICGRFFGNP